MIFEKKLYDLRRKESISQEKFADILLFILYSFMIPLACIVIMENISFCKEGIANLLLYGLEGASPAVAAIILNCQSGGKKNLSKFLKSRYKKNLDWRLCCIAFLVPAVLLTIAKLITYLTPYHNQFLTIPSAKKLLIILWALVAEELGWRGYLQQKVNKRLSNTLTPLIVGVIWSLWHYHFWISGTMEVPIVLFIYGCIAESYGYYVITDLSGENVVPASIWHFSGNLFFNLYLLNPNWNSGSILPYVIASMSYSLCIVIFIFYQKLGWSDLAGKRKKYINC